MKTETFIKICNKALEKDITLGTVSPELLRYMTNRPYNTIPFDNVCFRYNDLLLCFLIYIRNTTDLVNGPEYIVYLSILSGRVEVSYFISRGLKENDLVLKLNKRKEQQLEEVLKEFLGK